MKLYYVYIPASLTRVLYVGITSDLATRLASHRSHQYPHSFTARYRVHRLVYLEEFTRPIDAIRREKQMKGWRRSKKVALIERTNPEWMDLAPSIVPTSSFRS